MCLSKLGEAGTGSYFLASLLILFVEMKWSNVVRYIFLLRTLKVLSRVVQLNLSCTCVN